MDFEINSLRITKLKEYMYEVVQQINLSIKEVNVNALDTDINSYSLDKVPTSSTVEKWINGIEIHKDVYTFNSRANYSLDVMDNLQNIGFFETLENLIETNNRKGILPEITGIQSIECLNCGALSVSDSETAVFNIQIQITYKIGG